MSVWVRVVRLPANVLARVDIKITIFYYLAGVPGGLVGGPRAYSYQFRGFKSHRVHNRKGFGWHEN